MMDTQDSLTDREREILLLLAEGFTNREIAQRLYLAYKTVKWHNTQIYSKLGVTNRKQAIEQARQRGLLGAPPPTTIRHNLPHQTTPFIGRQQELDSLARLMDDPRTRLVTILAPGGMGKTRLALALAEQQINNFPDGVFFVPLVPLRSPDDIINAIAENVGFSFYSGEPPKQQLLDYFRKRFVLLVLDNFEHLLEGAPLITDMLHAAPQVKVLATSREKLNLSGETVFTLAGLRFLDGDTPEVTLEFDAAKMFMESARRVRSDFELHANSFNHLARICRLTEGMPLGIELAAGWVDVLSLDQIASELQQGIDILETELRDVPERHQSIRSTFERTWNRLNDDEQTTFAKLSIFRGGFTTQAAQAVAGADRRQLRKLVDKVLIQTLPTGRYDIHELLRQFGRSKLLETGELPTLQASHAAFYAGFMEEHEADIKGHRQLEGLNEIEADFDNVKLAWEYAIKHAAYTMLDRMMECMVLFCGMRTRYQEGEGIFLRAIETLSPSPDKLNLILNRLQIHWFRIWQLSERYPIPESIHEQLAASLKVARQQKDQSGVAWSLLLQGDFEFHAHSFSEATLGLFEEALVIFRNLGKTYTVGRVLRSIASCYFRLGPAYQNQFERHVQELHDLTRDMGDKTGMAHAILYRAAAEERQGNQAQAAHLSQAAADIWREMGDRKSLGFTVLDRAFNDLYRGEWVGARQAAQQAVAIGSDINYAWHSGFGLAILGFMAVIDGDYETGRRLGQEAVSYTARLWLHDHTSQRVLCLAAYGLGEFHEARHRMWNSLQVLSNQFHLADAFYWLAIAAPILAHEGKHTLAVEVLAMVRSYPDTSTGWMAHWQLLPDVQRDLESALGAATFQAAWTRGKDRELSILVTKLLSELAEP